MPAITLRPASAADRVALEALIAECYGAIYPGWYDTDVLEEAMPQMLRIDARLLESGRYFVALADGELAGCGGWSANAPGRDASATGHIRHFATRPELMRKGVGGAILDRCVADARTSDVTGLQCFSSLPGEAFYARHGFRRIDTVTIMLGESAPFSAVLMRKDLS